MKVLQFSGGIDSLATLFVKRPEWDSITVLWCDTGVCYPETYEYMDRISKLVPHFLRVKSYKESWEAKHGIAVDVVPEKYSSLGSLIFNNIGQKYTSMFHCCAANIWVPLERASQQLGAKVIIRGQRQSDVAKAPIRSGHQDSLGIQYEFPIEDWSRQQVLEYCKAECANLIPEYYALGERSSHDCWNCIAYLHDNVRRIQNLPYERREVVRKRLRDYKTVLLNEQRPLMELTND